MINISESSFSFFILPEQLKTKQSSINIKWIIYTDIYIYTTGLNTSDLCTIVRVVVSKIKYILLYYNYIMKNPENVFVKNYDRDRNNLI